MPKIRAIVFDHYGTLVDIWTNEDKPEVFHYLALYLQYYGADIDAVRGLLLEEARKHPLFLADPEPSVRVMDADNLGVTVRLMSWAATQADALTVATEVREAVLAKLADVAAPVGINWGKAMSQTQAP